MPMRSSVKIKLVAIFFLSFLPMILLYLVMYQLSQWLLINEAITSMQNQNQDFSDRLDDDLQRILSTNHILATNWELGKLAVVPDDFSAFEKSIAISNIQDKIFLAQLTSRFVESIDVYIPAIDKCISTNQSLDTLQNMRLLADKIDRIQCDQFIYYEGKMSLMAQNSYNPEDGPALVIRTVLSPNNITDMLRFSAPEDISQGMLFNLSDLTVLSNQNLPDESAVKIIDLVAGELRQEETAGTSGTVELSIGRDTFQAFYTYLEYGDVVVVRYFNQNDIGVNFTHMNILMISFVVIVSLVFLSVYRSLNKIVHIPLDRLMKAFQKVMDGDLNVAIQVKNQSEFKTIYEGFNRMVLRIKELIKQTYQQTIYLQQAELKQLQAQIDPHFLYNSFFILNKRIRADDKQGALTFSYAISEYFQYVTYHAQNTMPLDKEVEHAYNYARIQQIRFSNRLTLSLERPPDKSSSIETPRLFLQPVLENVFKHVVEKDQNRLELHARFERRANGLCIHIEDNGRHLTDETITMLTEKLEHQSSIQETSGLINVHRRLQLFYGEDYGISVGRSDMGGLHVILKIGRERKL